MPVSVTSVSRNGQDGAGAPPRGAAPAGVGRRRQVPWMLAGVLLVVGCALAFALTSLRFGPAARVLVVAAPVAAGQQLSAADLRTAPISAGAGVTVIPAAKEASVLGRPAAAALTPGTLLSPGLVGAASPVPVGFDLVAAALKAGQYPPGLAAGDRVQVVPVPATTGSGGASTASALPALATVVSVQPAPSGSPADVVVSLQVRDADADGVATLVAVGQAVLVQLPAGSGG